MNKIVIAGGCFWGVEAYYAKLKGIISTEVGYANGKTDNPTYQDVKKGTTDFVEAVILTYDQEITLENILEHLFRFIDPTALNKQGEDEGTQYRTGVYYQSTIELNQTLSYIESKQKDYQLPIVVEVKALEKFYSAEDYHQKYLDKNPSGYCHVNFSLINPDELKTSH
jgi:methionine-S-sulfoxide reductase